MQTISSISGDAFCCKGDYNDEYCEHGQRHIKGGMEIKTICSPPSFESNPESSTYADVMTGQRNYQMFAFCPGVNSQACGAVGTETKLTAGLETKRHVANIIMYRPQTPPFVGGTRAAYDACHSEISMDESLI